MSLKELKYMLGSTTHVTEDTDFMGYGQIDIVNLMGHGVMRNQLVEVCTSSTMLGIPG